MKHETASLLKKFHDSNRLKFIDSDKGLELEHDLSDEEKTSLVKSEYGETIVGNLDDLFIKIMRHMISIAAERAKVEFKDKLSDL